MENERGDIRSQSIKYKKLQTLMYHINKETLIKEHQKQTNNKASGIDKMTKEKYEMNLYNNIEDLIQRMKSFKYKPQAVRRTYIPKANGKLRPLGIPAYEDKLVQGVMANILNEIYEPRFLDCTYGFRPNRNCHTAISKIKKTIMTKPINYILDADIKGFFDNVEHEWLIKFLENDIEDKNFIRYIVRFLKSGIMEKEVIKESLKGTPQGGLISPVLANVYLHYVLDSWVEKWIEPRAKGYVEIVRYADDFIVMFQYENEAKSFYEVLRKRLSKFNLELEESKTRIIPFGRLKGSKDSFDFLGFTHINAKTRKGKYIVKHKTSKKKMKAKRKEFKMWMKENMHKPIVEIMETIKKKLIGHYNYYGINNNSKSICEYYLYVKWTTYRILNRRHQKRSMSYELFNSIWAGLAIPIPHIKVNIG